MRKKDYETLAAALARETLSARTWENDPDEMSRAIAAARLACADRLARYLAEHLAVDREKFLTACGVKP
jgi:hypothetical protein